MAINDEIGPSYISKNNAIGYICVSSMFFDQYVEFFVVLLCLLFKKRIYINKKIIFLICLISLYSIISIISLEYNIHNFYKRGISVLLIMLIYNGLFFSWREKLQVIWNIYCRVCYTMAILGFIQVIVSIVAKVNIFYLFNTYDFHVYTFYQPPTATLLESSDFAVMLTPCISYNVLKNKSIKNIPRKTWFILGITILCFSNLSILGILLTWLLWLFIWHKRFAYSFISIFILLFIIFGNAVVHEYDTQDANSRGLKSVSVKFSQSIDALSYINDIDMISSYNLSSFATFSNLYVAIYSPCRITGTGLGTHEDNYISVFPDQEDDENFRSYGLNKEDAYSLLTRLFSELGIIGLGIYLYFVLKNLDKSDPISLSIFILIAMHLIGNGNYFINGFVFFNYIYYYRHKYAKKL